MPIDSATLARIRNNDGTLTNLKRIILLVLLGQKH